MAAYLKSYKILDQIKTLTIAMLYVLSKMILTFSNVVSELDIEFSLLETLRPVAVAADGPGPDEGPAEGPTAVFAAAELLLLRLKEMFFVLI